MARRPQAAPSFTTYMRGCKGEKRGAVRGPSGAARCAGWIVVAWYRAHQKAMGSAVLVRVFVCLQGWAPNLHAEKRGVV
jgi:hypothetical protein